MKLKTTIYGKQATMIGTPAEISALLDSVRRTARQRAIDSLPQVAEQAKSDAGERVVVHVNGQEVERNVAPIDKLKTTHVTNVFKPQFTPIAQSREEIVKEAIADVAELLKGEFFGLGIGATDLGRKVRKHTGHSVCFGSNDEIANFFVNNRKRVVLAKIYSNHVTDGNDNGSYISTGIARFAPSDVFNEHVGKAIALRRALGLEVPTKYYEVGGIAPEGKQVGDVVEFYGDDVLYRNTLVGGYVGHPRSGKTGTRSFNAIISKVIDDSARYVAPSTPAAKVVYHG